MLFTWDALATVPDDKLAQYKIFMKIKKWDRACACWLWFPLMQRWINQIAWDHSYRLDVVTFNPEGFAESLRQRFYKHSVPINRVLAMEPDELAQQMAFMVDVVRVYFANPAHQFKFGHKSAMVPRHGIGWNPWV